MKECPKCKSTDIRKERVAGLKIRKLPFAKAAFLDMYICGNCKYVEFYFTGESTWAADAV